MTELSTLLSQATGISEETLAELKTLGIDIDALSSTDVGVKDRLTNIESYLALAIREINLHHGNPLPVFRVELTDGVASEITLPLFDGSTGTINEIIEDDQKVIEVVDDSASTYINLNLSDNFFIEVEVNAGTEYADIEIYRDSAGVGPKFRIDARDGNHSGFYGNASTWGGAGDAVPSATGNHEVDEWYTVRFEYGGGILKVFIDGVLFADRSEGHDALRTYFGLGHGKFRNISYGTIVAVAPIPSGEEVDVSMLWDATSGYTDNTDVTDTNGTFAYTNELGTGSEWIVVEFDAVHSSGLGDSNMRIGLGNKDTHTTENILQNKTDDTIRLQTSAKAFYGSQRLSGDVQPILISDDQEHTYAIVASKVGRFVKYYVDGSESFVLDLADSKYDNFFINFDKYYFAVKGNTGGPDLIRLRADSTTFKHNYQLVSEPVEATPPSEGSLVWTNGYVEGTVKNSGTDDVFAVTDTFGSDEVKSWEFLYKSSNSNKLYMAIYDSASIDENQAFDTNANQTSFVVAGDLKVWSDGTLLGDNTTGKYPNSGNDDYIGYVINRNTGILEEYINGVIANSWDLNAIGSGLIADWANLKVAFKYMSTTLTTSVTGDSANFAYMYPTDSGGSMPSGDVVDFDTTATSAKNSATWNWNPGDNFGTVSGGTATGKVAFTVSANAGEYSKLAINITASTNIPLSDGVRIKRSDGSNETFAITELGVLEIPLNPSFAVLEVHVFSGGSGHSTTFEEPVFVV